MKMQLAKTIALDFATGFASFSFVLLVALWLHNIHNLPFFLLAVSALIFLAGSVRASAPRLSPWLNGAVVSLGASLPTLLLGRAVGLVTFGVRSAALVLALAAVCACGAHVRSQFQQARTLSASALTVALFATVFLLGKFALPRLMASTRPQAINKPAPKFTLTMLDGTPVSLESLRGHVVVLDFWGTWCAPCLAEMPTLDTLYDHYKGNPDVIFVLVNSGLNGDTPDKVRAFSKGHHLRIPVALDLAGAADSLGTQLLPSLILLDKNGNIRMQESGYQGPQSLRTKLMQEVETLLQAR